MTMQEFFSKAGGFQSHRTEVTGVFPKRTVTVHFTYAHGTASFDGAVWVYKLTQRVGE